MSKLIILVFVLGLFMTFNGVRGGGFMDDIQELDEMIFTAALDINRPDRLPTTPRGIIESWCKPLLFQAMKKMDLVSSIFRDNPLFLILYRIGEMTKINMGTKFCYNRRVIGLVAHFNKLTNRIIPDLIPWYKMTLNTLLAVAHPHSPIDAGGMICLMKKLGRRLLDSVPPPIQQGIIKYMIILQERQSGLATIILRHMNVNLNIYACHIVHHPVPNPLGIKSHEVAALLAWDRVLKRY